MQDGGMHKGRSDERVDRRWRGYDGEYAARGDQPKRDGDNVERRGNRAREEREGEIGEEEGETLDVRAL